jgi:hypothetical protein
MAGDSKLTGAIRVRGHRGGVISIHRAFAHYQIYPISLLIGLSLSLAFFLVWIALLPTVCGFWGHSVALGLRYLPLQARLDYARHDFVLLQLETPELRMDPVLPDSRIWYATFSATALIFIAMFFVSKNFVPIAYLVRAILAVQFSALIYFALWPSHFAHTPDSYMQALLDSGIGIISIVPLLFGLTYYIFDFGFLRKAFLTTLTMTHLTVFIPFQIILHALVLQKSVLFMPLLYIVFGTPLDVLLIVCFYSWGMTWSLRAMQPKNSSA